MSSTRPGTDAQTVWDAVADAWDRHHVALADQARPISRRLVDLVDPQPDGVVLELAAGLGELSLDLAARLSPDGRVIGTDLSPRMVEMARRRHRDAGNVSFEVLDAQRTELPDDSVDAIVCKMGLMLFDDPDAAVTECRRVLRPGGRLAVATWGPADRNPWITSFGAAMLACGHELPGDPNGPGGIFSLSELDTLRRLLTAGGFEDVTVETVELHQRFASFGGYWRHVSETSGPLTVMLEALPPDEADAVATTCEQFTAHLCDDDGYVFPACALVAVGR